MPGDSTVPLNSASRDAEHVDRAPDQRNPFQRDRDRILYSSHLRRLGGVTQVVDVAQGRSFHNRLVHTHKVEQVARRIAEKFVTESRDECIELGGLSVSACEAAALAHDLGHPPFGHAGETTLDGLARRGGVTDGFEGNAQSFRIVTRLARRNVQFEGLNLTARTLNGVLKYPWTRRAAAGHRREKFGAYGDDQHSFEWARERVPDHMQGQDVKTLEAQVMDLADDITYAVHDIEDFYRAGLVPLHRLLNQDGEDGERGTFMRGVVARWKRERDPRANDRDTYAGALERVLDEVGEIYAFALSSPFTGREDQRAALRSLTSGFISRYVEATHLILEHGPGNEVALEGTGADLRAELAILKQIIWHYVITGPALSHQQEGQTAMLTEVWKRWHADAHSRYARLLPPWARERLEELRESLGDQGEIETAIGRVVLDAICSLTEPQVASIYRRLTGHDGGSVLDPIVDA